VEFLPAVSAPAPSPGGHVYFIQNDQFVKIGRARNVKARLGELQVSHSQALRLVGVIACTDARETEAAWHRRHAAVHVRGEWFRLDPVLLAAIQDLTAASVPGSVPGSEFGDAPSCSEIGASQTLAQPGQIGDPANK